MAEELLTEKLKLICEENYPHPQAEKLLNQAFDNHRTARDVYALRQSLPVTQLCWGIESCGMGKASQLIAVIRYWEISVQAVQAEQQMKGRYLLLGPLGVMPNQIGKGYGKKLLKHTLGLAENLSTAADYQAICVSGEAGYYQKLGFKPVSIISPHNTPPNIWQIYYTHPQAEIFSDQQELILQSSPYQ